MSGQQSLKVTKRDTFGTGAARACRKAGMVPGILYGANKAPEGLSIDPRALAASLKPGFSARVFNLELEGANQQALVKAVQRHPLTDEPLHIDFMRITKGTRVHINVPIHFINEDKAAVLKRGGVLNIVHHRIEVIAAADAMPESFTVDLSALDLSKGIHISDLNMPSGAVAAHAERDNTIATVVMPKTEAAEAE